MVWNPLMPSNRGTDVRRTRDDDPFALMRREMDRVFDDFMHGFGTPAASLPEGVISPRVNVVEKENSLEITAELPGVDQKDIELDLSEGMLTLKAEHKQEKEEGGEDERYHVVERAYGTYMRRFAIPFESDQDKVEARFENGVLNVSVPRSAEAEKRTRKIEVRSG